MRWSTTSGCTTRCRTACWRCCACRVSVRAPSSSSMTSAASTRSTRCGPPPADGQLRGVKGVSERTEQNILAGIARLDRKITRVLLHEADEMIADLLARLREVPGVVRIEPAGSLRRRRATIGDLDLLAATEEPGGPDRRPRWAEGGRSDPVGRHRQVEHRARRRTAGRPHGLPAGGVGNAPRPLHRQQGAQRQAARDGPRSRAVAVGEGIQGGRDRRAAARCHRGGRLRPPRPAVDSTRAARGRGRDPGGAEGRAADAGGASAT